MKKETLEKGIKLQSRIDEISKNLEYLKGLETGFWLWKNKGNFLFNLDWDSEENEFLEIQLITWYENELKKLQSELKAL